MCALSSLVLLGSIFPHDPTGILGFVSLSDSLREDSATGHLGDIRTVVKMYLSVV